MRLYWYWSRQLTWRQGMWAFGTIGLGLLGLAVYLAGHVTLQLFTWPRVEAGVDSADVAPWTNRAQTSYAARLWLSYRFNGRDYHVLTTTAGQGWGEYDVAAKIVLDAKRVGHLVALLDPNHPARAVPRLDPAWTLFFFSFVLGCIGGLFAAFGVGCLMMGRRQGFGAVSAPMTSSPRAAGPWFVWFGVTFVLAAVVGAVLGPEGRSWPVAHARVDSVQVARVSAAATTQPGVNRSVDDGLMFAVRTWVTYSLRDQRYQTEITASTRSSDSAAVARRARAITVGEPLDIRVDPANPFRVVKARADLGDEIMIPGVFGLIGAAMLAVGLIIRRVGLKQRRVAAPHAQGTATSSRRARRDDAVRFQSLPPAN